MPSGAMAPTADQDRGRQEGTTPEGRRRGYLPGEVLRKSRGSVGVEKLVDSLVVWPFGFRFRFPCV